jgi:hypothetical protein
MALIARKMALLAKLETVINTDSVPVPATNAILVLNVDVTPLESEIVSRDLMRPYLGNKESITSVTYGRLSYEVEIAGAGAAGTAPKYGPLLRACGMAEAISAGVKVSYTPVSTGFEAVSQYYWVDGVLHKFIGNRGTVDFDFKAKGVPTMKFAFTGLIVPVTDSALAAATYSQILPLAVNKANTTLSLHGINVVSDSVMAGLRNDIKYRNLINFENVDLVDRAPGGSISMEATTMATKNWFTTASATTQGILNLVHGTTAGNKCSLICNQTVIRNPKYAELDGIRMINADMEFWPTTAGNDELTFEVA